MNKVVRLKDNLIVKVENNSPELSATKTEAEMDYRAKEAVKSALNKARVCKKPIAKYDVERKKAYIEMANGEKNYV